MEALAEGRLHLAASCLLAPYLTPQNAGELIEAATHRRKSDIEELLAERFPSKEVPARVRAIAALASVPQLAPGQVEVGGQAGDGVAACDRSLAPGQVDVPSDPPFAPEAGRFLLQVTIPRSTKEKLRYAQNLLSHAVPSGDMAQVLDRALEALIAQLEKQKIGATTRRTISRAATPRFARARPRTRKRYVPAHVRRAVWERDQGRCSFIGANGRRCDSRRFLEFDHVDPVARGGKATVEGMRLRCRGHNQLEAERAFGAGLMERTRQEARHARAEARVRAMGQERFRDVVAGLRSLGCRADEARRAAAYADSLPTATLEERMRAALGFLGRRSVGSKRMIRPRA